MNRPQPSTFSLGPNGTIRDVIECIDRSRYVGLALIVDDEGRLENTISDGDVRRGILAGISLDAPVTELLPIKATTPHPAATTAPATEEPTGLLRIMQENAVRSVPLLDTGGRVVDVVALQELLPQPEVPVHAVIMAGGFGKRLRPLTEDVPKPMLHVNGRPLLEGIVLRLRESGIRQINVTTHFRPEKIVEHFGDGEAFGVDITYVNEDRPLGTGGALGLMPVPDDTTLVINGDVLTQVDFRTMLMYHRAHQADMTVAVSQYGIAVPYGVIECEGPQVCRLTEKPQLNFLVNAGIYLLEPSVYHFVPGGECLQMTDLIERLLEAGRRVVSFPIFEQWLDIGQHDDYALAQDMLAAPHEGT
jgi:dTDP-glucose pyrophosphorylase/CBS domain-containing protein